MEKTDNPEVSPLFRRNIGFLTHDEQKRLSDITIGIAGCGGDGGLLAERLARFGVGALLLADPDVFEPHNINRQFAAHVDSLYNNKACVVAEELRRINPGLKLTVYDKGVDQSNIREFVTQSDILVDEIDYSTPEISVMLAREARKQEKFVFMGANVGWGASIFCFDPKGITFEEYFNYNETERTVDIKKYVVQMPGYFNEELLDQIANGEVPAPGLSSSVALVAALLSSQVVLFALQKGELKGRIPHAKFFDTYDLFFERR